MFMKIAIGLGAVIAAFAGIVALQPSNYSVTRSASIAAPPAEIFALVNDFHNWEAWSPWEKLDPAMKKTYAGAPAGIGATYMWAGNDQAGEGRMTVLESKPGERVGIKLEFIKPFASLCSTEFTFTPEGGGTVVNWTMSGENDFMGKAIALFSSMDKMVGPDFEKGLAQMKTLAEARTKKAQ